MITEGDNFPREMCENNRDNDCALYFDCPLLVNYCISKKGLKL